MKKIQLKNALLSAILIAIIISSFQNCAPAKVEGVPSESSSADLGSTSPNTTPTATPTPAPTPAPSYALSILLPAAGATVSNAIQVYGNAPGMLNVEIFDAVGNFLAQSTPTSSGSFSASVDTKKLSNGLQNLVVKAFDSNPGQAFSHSDQKSVSINVQNIVALPTPTPISGVIQLVYSANICLDLDAASPLDGATIGSYNCEGTLNQRWMLSPRGMGYELVSLSSNKCAAVTSFFSSPGYPYVQQATCNGDPSQIWIYLKNPDDTFKLVNSKDSQCLDTPNIYTLGWQLMQTGACADIVDQKFRWAP